MIIIYVWKAVGYYMVIYIAGLLDIPDSLYVITNGGPSRSSEIHALLIFRQAFEFSRFGYSAVISVLFFLSLLIFSLIQLRLFKSGAIQG